MPVSENCLKQEGGSRWVSMDLESSNIPVLTRFPSVMEKDDRFLRFGIAVSREIRRLTP